MSETVFNFFNGLGNGWEFSSITEMVLAFSAFFFIVTLATIGFIIIYKDNKKMW
jgi:hypothetical protein